MSDDITCSVSTNQKSVAGRIQDIILVHIALIIDSLMEVSLSVCVVFPVFGKFSQKSTKTQE